MEKFNISKMFAVLTPNKDAHTVEDSPAVFNELDRKFGDFAGHELIALFKFDTDWTTW